jgi:hypothetical protein
MFYLNEAKNENYDDGGVPEGDENINDDDMTYRVHKRIMGWKLTSPKKRTELIRVSVI